MKRHDNWVRKFCEFMGFREIKKRHYGDSVADVEADLFLKNYAIDIKTSKRGFRLVTMAKEVKEKYGKEAIIVVGPYYQRKGYVLITWDLFKLLLRKANYYEERGTLL